MRRWGDVVPHHFIRRDWANWDDHEPARGHTPTAALGERENVESLKELGVSHVGPAPADGRSGWSAAASRTG